MRVDEERLVWFGNKDIRDSNIRCWPDDFVDFIREEIEYAIGNNLEHMAEHLWVISNCLRGTFFVDRLIEDIATHKSGMLTAQHLAIDDFQPPILSRDLQDMRSFWFETHRNCDSFLTVLKRCIEENTSIAKLKVQLEVCDKLGLDSNAQDNVSNALHQLLDWTLRDVELGKPLAANFPTAQLKDGLRELEQSFVWGGVRFDELTPTIVDVLKLLHKGYQEGRPISLLEMDEHGFVAEHQSFYKIFKVKRAGKKFMHPVRSIVVGRGSYRLIDPRMVPQKDPQ